MATDMTAQLALQRPSLGQIFHEEVPLRRIGDRTDLKTVVVLLLSEASAYTTGSEMLITGGLHTGRIV